MVESLIADFNDHIRIDSSKAARYLNQEKFRVDEDGRNFPAYRLKSLKIDLFTRSFYYSPTN